MFTVLYYKIFLSERIDLILPYTDVCTALYTSTDVCTSKQEVVGSNPVRVACDVFSTDTRKAPSIQYRRISN